MRKKKYKMDSFEKMTLIFGSVALIVIGAIGVTALIIDSGGC